MPTSRVGKPSSKDRRLVLHTKVLELGFAVEMPCSPCARSNSLCVFSLHSARCSECIRKNARHCNGGFSFDEFDRLTVERKKLEAARSEELTHLSEATARLAASAELAASLGRRIDALRDKQERMVGQEDRLLATLGEEEPPPAPLDPAAFVLDDQQLAALFDSPQPSSNNP